MNTRIKELENKINQARHDYYNAQSTITDNVYDALIDELSELDPKNLAVIGIGAEPVSNWEKYEHKVVLGSLNKAQTKDEFEKWAKDYVAKGDQFFLTLKLDGLSVSLIYEEGVLVNGATRGAGKIGEKITANVARMQGVPLRLPQKINATIRGEILLSKENHKKYFETYNNTRNAASGVSRRYTGENCDKLNVLVYEIISDDLEFSTQEDQFKALDQLGFQTPQSYLLSTVEEVWEWREKYQTVLREQDAYDLDGLVCHQNDLSKKETAGIHNGKPYAVIAIKFNSVAREGYVSSIITQVGNSGRLTPVAIFNPKVNLMGAEVEKASLHNFSNIRDLGVGIGSTVLVCRSGDVIPFVEEVITEPEEVFLAPTHCPECNAEVVEKGEYIQCPNTLSCPAQMVGRLKNYIKELNILEWGDTMLERLVETKKVITIADLYTLTIDDLASMERMGKKSATKCYDILHANKEVALEVFLGALSIPLIGQSTIKAIMEAGTTTLDMFFRCNLSDLENVNGVGPTRAQSLYEGLQKNKDLITQLLNNGITIKTKEKIMGNLNGKNFCLTGKMERKREELEEMIVAAGGEVSDSVNKKTTHLVIADVLSQSSKAVKARKMGTALISEQDLLEMLV